jgi:hypothetical protein
LLTSFILDLLDEFVTECCYHMSIAAIPTSMPGPMFKSALTLWFMPSVSPFFVRDRCTQDIIVTQLSFFKQQVFQSFIQKCRYLTITFLIFNLQHSNMTDFNTELATTISGEEHRPEYAEENASAFLAMAQGVAETYGLDQDEIRIENNQHGDNFFVVEENGELETYVVSNPDSDVDYDNSQEERNWQRSMTVGQFEESLENK